MPGMERHGLALIAAASLAPAAGAAGTPCADHAIRPGVGAGGVRLGMSEGQVLRVLGRPEHRRATTSDVGRFITLTWPGISVRRWDGAGGRVIEIRVTDRGIRLANGVGVGSPLSRVRRAFPRASCAVSSVVCMIGGAEPGETVITTLRFGPRGCVREVSVGRVID
jgi:hypothetical protein